ncbi:DUF4232 domain-containing protein [Streptomyces luteocolor]|uniref:DUF4232 domain-containing protein n=1 Tax=Streptomyces luteocolor TaxID=285500 RepID=UPI0008535D6A|nr:DUF4232 domain-containing protein [Streptomyces luteocolor]
MRTFRNRTTVLAAAGAAVLALSLTACGGDDSGAKSAGTGGGTKSSATVDTAKSDTKSGTTSDATSDTGSSASSGTGAAGSAGAKATNAAAGNGKQAAAATPTCTTKDLAISAARQDGPPYTHIVLTAKNTSGKTCRMNGFPEIQFLESHKQNVPAVAKSKPASPVVLKAGAPAYALVKVSDGGAHEDNEPVSAFSVTLQGGGGMAAVRAPGSGGIAVDPAKALTGYWTYELRNGADDF